MKTSSFSFFLSVWHRLQHTWKAGSANERRLLGTALAVLLLALLWWAALGPALGTLRGANAQHRTLDAQLLTMRGLATETASMQAMPRIKTADSRSALEQSVRDLGPLGRLSIAGERATVTFKDVPADTLVKWLVQTRKTARAKPAEMHMTLNAMRTAWDGNVVLLLPPP